MKRLGFVLLLAFGIALWATACGEEEGPGEEAGRKFDEAIDRLRDAGDGPMEQLGEDIDEALEDARKALDEAVEDARKAAKDARR
jgi:hypothetical protein